MVVYYGMKRRTKIEGAATQAEKRFDASATKTLKAVDNAEQQVAKLKGDINVMIDKTKDILKIPLAAAKKAAAVKPKKEVPAHIAEQNRRVKELREMYPALSQKAATAAVAAAIRKEKGNNKPASAKPSPKIKEEADMMDVDKPVTTLKRAKAPKPAQAAKPADAMDEDDRYLFQ